MVTRIKLHVVRKLKLYSNLHYHWKICRGL